MSHNSECSYDIWDLGSAVSQKVSIIVLLPNGIILPLDICRKTTLIDLKGELFEEAQNYPLFGVLHDMQCYVFVCVNQTSAEQEELIEEQKRICDVKPFQGIMKLIERQEDQDDRINKNVIGLLIGKGLHEFDALKNPEVNDFRWKMKIFSEEMALERKGKTWMEKLLYQYPLNLDSTIEAPAHIFERMINGKVVLNIHFAENSKGSFKFYTPPETSADELTRKVLAKKAFTTGSHLEDSEDYVLKVCGREEFLLGSYPLGQYKFIREMIAKHKTPELILFPAHYIDLENQDHYEVVEKLETCKRTSFYGTTISSKKKCVSSWSISEYFTIRVNRCCKLNCVDSTMVIVKAGLFHGGELLCQIASSGESSVEDGECSFEDDLLFDLQVGNLPRMTRLCLAVAELNRNSKLHRNKRSKHFKTDTYNRLAWVNTTVFDFKNTLKSGAMTLHMWPFSENCQTEDTLNPLGPIVSNPNADSNAAILITFDKYHESNNVCYPALETVLESAARDLKLENGDISSAMPHASKVYLEQIKQICDRDPLHQMHEQEKELLWFLRLDCCHSLPQSLPKLLRSCKWNDPRDVAQMTALLQVWPPLLPEIALELLDYAYADQSVRTYAVNCFKSMSDEKLSLYLLQLVQALKHESYLYGDLAKFLLERALNNQHIGHALFWLLRSEMHSPSVSVLYGVVLEAYCYGAPEHVKQLSKQVESLKKLKGISEMIHSETQKHKEPKEIKQWMHTMMSEDHFKESFQGLLNPLDPSQKIQQLRVEKCRFMDSKMKPLWLVFENYDNGTDDVMFMFKNGDDLRQDMLTLQMIRIMDSLWKEEGHDFRMIPYLCIATDDKVGLIEIVRDSNTIANIQLEKGHFTTTSTFTKGSLLAWLKERNPTEASLNMAIEEFTLSCVGYCVATYVLGIADRHSDNIMLNANGQLFHIDFGHILGNFKEKFGIRRERVPFVLTHDFVFVITGGQNQKSQEFNRFQHYCEQAFMILRRKGPLIISLFAMMLSTGMPELTCEKDLEYLQETLVLDRSETEALNHFRNKFDEALKNSWKTSINWLVRALAKNKKIQG